MKSKVKLSAYCTTVTLIVTIALIIGIVANWNVGSKFYLLVVISASLFGFGLFYLPTSVEATRDALVIHRLFRSKRIPYGEISSVDRCLPSAGGLRLCGSGGFMGYWGYFNDIIIGSYFGYYGNYSQCILVKLKGGRQYVVSCENPDRMVSYVNEETNSPTV